MTFRTRFAPSPTGPLHLGHAYSALLAHDLARANKGTFYLRFDDIDQSRARVHWAEQIKNDLAWLGVRWDGPIWSQHARATKYLEALQYLRDLGVVYNCCCSRKDISAAANAPQEGSAIIGPDGLIYPGTCRDSSHGAGSNTATRLNMRKALQLTEITEIKFSESDKIYVLSADKMITNIGDVVIARKGMAASYHLSIVVDDAEQEITHVIRGEDLREATFIHILLQKLLKLPTPIYHHHRLVRDENGKRLAKRDDARSIAKYKDDGMSPNDIRQLVGL